ncbi:hypothetical protein JCM17960_34170 [Magnetospira thiophila]
MSGWRTNKAYTHRKIGRIGLGMIATLLLAASALADPAKIGGQSSGGLNFKDLGSTGFGEGSFLKGKNAPLSLGTPLDSGAFLPTAPAQQETFTPDATFSNLSGTGERQTPDLYNQPKASPASGVNLGRILDMYGATPQAPTQTASPAVPGQQPPEQDPTDPATREALSAIKAALSSPGGASTQAPTGGGEGGGSNAPPLIVKEAFKDIADTLLDPVVQSDGTVSISVLGLGRIDLNQGGRNMADQDVDGGSGSNTDFNSSTFNAGATTDAQNQINEMQTRKPVERTADSGFTGIVKSLLGNWIFYLVVLSLVIMLIVLQRTALRGR